MTEPTTSNVNVTLPESAPGPFGRFPCPACDVDLDLRLSKRDKPYCICVTCGVQVFFRGKIGIARVREIAARADRQPGSARIAMESVSAYARLERLRAERTALGGKRGFLTIDEPLEHAIDAIEGEIARVEEFLRTSAARASALPTSADEG